MVTAEEQEENRLVATVQEKAAIIDKIQYVAGWLLLKASRAKTLECSSCKDALIGTAEDQRSFMKCKTYRYVVSGLLTPSDALVRVVGKWEGTFVATFNANKTARHIMTGLKAVLQNAHPLNFVPQCHRDSIENELASCFVRLRLHHACKLINRAVRDDARRKSLRKMTKLGGLSSSTAASSRIVKKAKAVNCRVAKRQPGSSTALLGGSSRPSRQSKSNCLQKLWTLDDSVSDEENGVL